MNIIDFDQKPAVRLKKITKVLESRFGLTLNLSDPVKLIETLNYCEQFKANYKKNNNLTEADTNADYAKALMLSEAIRIILKEISPKRSLRIRRVK